MRKFSMNLSLSWSLRKDGATLYRTTALVNDRSPRLLVSSSPRPPRLLGNKLPPPLSLPLFLSSSLPLFLSSSPTFPRLVRGQKSIIQL